MLRTNCSNRYRLSCGPGALSGWYCTEKTLSAGQATPSTVSSSRLRWVTGQSIVDYLNNRRIEAAQKLLETTELSISAIAEQTGFASAGCAQKKMSLIAEEGGAVLAGTERGEA